MKQQCHLGMIIRATLRIFKQLMKKHKITHYTKTFTEFCLVKNVVYIWFCISVLA